MLKSNIKRDRFDFEVGHLVKSPCLTCKTRDNFPKCADDCRVLDEIRGVLAGGISCAKSS